VLIEHSPHARFSRLLARRRAPELWESFKRQFTDRRHPHTPGGWKCLMKYSRARRPRVLSALASLNAHATVSSGSCTREGEHVLQYLPFNPQLLNSHLPIVTGELMQSITRHDADGKPVRPRNAPRQAQARCSKKRGWQNPSASRKTRRGRAANVIGFCPHGSLARVCYASITASWSLS
jgi:hypothetical protein